jgi:hypothetical protein
MLHFCRPPFREWTEAWNYVRPQIGEMMAHLSR